MHVLSTGHNRDLSRKVGQVPSRIEAARLAELEPQRHPTNLLIAPSGDYVEVQAQSRALAKCHSGCVLLRSSHPDDQVMRFLRGKDMTLRGLGVQHS